MLRSLSHLESGPKKNRYILLLALVQVSLMNFVGQANIMFKINTKKSPQTCIILCHNSTAFVLDFNLSETQMLCVTNPQVIQMLLCSYVLFFRHVMFLMFIVTLFPKPSQWTLLEREENLGIRLHIHILRKHSLALLHTCIPFLHMLICMMA